MAGFMTRRESRKQYESIGGGNFNAAYKAQKDKLRQSGLRGRELRQTARQAVIDDQSLTNIQNAALKSSEQYAPTENTIAGIAAAGYDQNEKQMQRDNYSFRQSLLNEQPITLSKPAIIKDAPAQSVQQAQTPTGESVEVASASAEAPVSQPATVGTPQTTDATVETPAPGQPAQIQGAPVAQPEEPDYNSMSYNDTFRMARKLKGKDGTFEWKGKSYGLKYAEEVAAEKAAAAKAKAAGTNSKASTGATAQPSAPVATATQVASPTTTAQTQVKMQEQVTTPATQVDSSQSSQPSNLTKPATIVARRDSTIQNSSAAPEVTAAQTLQNKDISKPWNKTYQLGNRTLTHDQMEDYLFDGKLNDPNLYHGAPTMSPVPEEYTKNTDTSRFTFGRPISTSKLYADRASNITPRQQYSQQDLTDELRQIDSQTYYNQKTRRQAINNAYAKYNASR